MLDGRRSPAVAATWLMECLAGIFLEYPGSERGRHVRRTWSYTHRTKASGNRRDTGLPDKTVILIVEDDQNIVDLVRSNLSVRGHDVIVSKNGESIERTLELRVPDLVLLDLMLPDADGFELCREIRELSDVGIIVLSARRAETDKVRALNLGADDYMTKPFGIEELLARINATLRRSRPAPASPPEPTVVTIGDVEIDLGRRRVTKGGRLVHLTQTEFALLRQFAISPGVLLTHADAAAAGLGSRIRDADRVHPGLCGQAPREARIPRWRAALHHRAAFGLPVRPANGRPGPAGRLARARLSRTGRPEPHGPRREIGAAPARVARHVADLGTRCIVPDDGHAIMHVGDPNDETGDRLIRLVLAGLCSARTSFSFRRRPRAALRSAAGRVRRPDPPPAGGARSAASGGMIAPLSSLHGFGNRI